MARYDLPTVLRDLYASRIPCTLSWEAGSAVGVWFQPLGVEVWMAHATLEDPGTEFAELAERLVHAACGQFPASAFAMQYGG